MKTFIITIALITLAVLIVVVHTHYFPEIVDQSTYTCEEEIDIAVIADRRLDEFSDNLVTRRIITDSSPGNFQVQSYIFGKLLNSVSVSCEGRTVRPN